MHKKAQVLQVGPEPSYIPLLVRTALPCAPFLFP